MNDLVRRSEILFGLNVFSDDENGNEHFLNGIETAKEIVEGAIAVDAVPVVHGRWTVDNVRKYNGDYGSTLHGNIPQDIKSELVRCKDCKHYDHKEGTGWCDINSHMLPGGIDWNMFDEDDFCSRGERKTK